MNKSASSRRKRAQVAPAPESLETRDLMATGAGNTFALISGTLAQVSESNNVPVEVRRDQFSIGRNQTIILGVDVVGQRTSKLDPYIVSLEDRQGDPIKPPVVDTGGPSRSRPNPATTTTSTATQTPSSRNNAKLFTVHGSNITNTGYEINVEVAAKPQTTGTGGFIVGFYLPGDVNGNAMVDPQDLRLIRNAMNSPQSQYLFDADADRDGKINRFDMQIARANLGAATTVQPLITANLSPQSDTGLQDRITRNTTVVFEGTATPGTTIMFSDLRETLPDVSVTTKSDGSYNTTLQLNAGLNQFKVEAKDPFGQVFEGSLVPIRQDAAAPEAPPTTTPTTTTPTTTTTPKSTTKKTTTPTTTVSPNVPRGALTQAQRAATTARTTARQS